MTTNIHVDFAIKYIFPTKNDCFSFHDVMKINKVKLKKINDQYC